MPVFRLEEEVVFPHPSLSESDGLLAVGGDLSMPRLLLAYRYGIFPWFNEDDPILWWSPDPRCVIFPNTVHISRSLNRLLKQRRYQVTFNKDFNSIMQMCGTTRPEGTWITDDMLQAYTALNKAGYAESIEVWDEGVLVGGLYGVRMGNCFFAESMFSLKPNTSKIALIHLCQKLISEGGVIIDCQMPSDHLFRMGAVEISRKEFLDILDQHISPLS